MDKTRINQRKKKKKLSWKKIILIIILLLILAIGAFVLKVYMDAKSTVKTMHEEIPDRAYSSIRGEEVSFSNQDPFSVLLLGVDSREGDSGRSDTMIVMTLNPADKSAKMVSLPRDTLTEMVGKDTEDKLNHAYAFGGVKMALDSTENLLDIPLDVAVQVNMESFQEIVDAVDGVTVNNDLAFDNFAEGEITLDGKEALDFVRMRKEDPRGDFGRQQRQRQVVQAILKEGASVNSLLNYKSIFDSIGNNVRTNIDWDDMVVIQKNYREPVKNIEQLYFEEGQGETINGVWYYIMNDDELSEISETLQSHLNL